METALEKAKELSAMGIENTLVSMGPQGAVLVTGQQAFSATVPQVQAVSTIGAGDSTIAGFLAGAYAGEGAMGCLKTAVSYGTAACLTAGTLPPEKEDIEKIYAQISVTEVM
jgi:fructose-1-phosphate kinase PfkB-like protein